MSAKTFDQLDEERLSANAALFEALAHPVRLRIVCGLLDGDCCVGDITECLGLEQAYVSRHLAILRKAAVVEPTIDGRRRVYRVVHPLVPALVELLKNSQNPGSVR